MSIRIKFPRTVHFSWSDSIHDDDKSIQSTEHLMGMEVVVTEKLDGESTSMYKDYMHARSIDSAHNFTRDYAKTLQATLSQDIPDGWIFSFENVAYCHSIFYDNLEGFCYLLKIWKDDGFCLSYDEQCQWADILDLPQPKVFYRGVFDEKKIKSIKNDLDLNKIEGFVVSNTHSFHRDEYQKNVAKFVRKNHVQSNHVTDHLVQKEVKEVEHWLKNTYPNQLSQTLRIKPNYLKPNLKNKKSI